MMAIGNSKGIVIRLRIETITQRSILYYYKINVQRLGKAKYYEDGNIKMDCTSM
jgi:hypothetical protein